MTLKTVLSALALSLIPVISYAQCSGHEQQAQSCAQGFVWDVEQQACVDRASS
ncbi:carbohydrate-binding module family 14 protein [Albibacillus kandeliae]|uniref:carbohydrate-binding module family 14 protein n=1 Tax=Albibacillus kandeliae TaxID=2174228 RepID=UPI000D699543|nr:carbohydrate-binding module family 14 protein [Albibacillus kandeliae]